MNKRQPQIVHPLLPNGLFPILDKNLAQHTNVASLIEQFIEADSSLFLVRQKDLNDNELTTYINEILALAELMDFNIVIHNNIALCQSCNAAGVHIAGDIAQVGIARSLLDDSALIGYSAHTLKEAQLAEAEGADYIFLGAIFETEKNHPYPLLGIDTLKQTCETLDIPVYAIGGINEQNIVSIKSAGAYGFSALRAVYQEKEIEHTVSKFGFLWEE